MNSEQIDEIGQMEGCVACGGKVVARAPVPTYYMGGAAAICECRTCGTQSAVCHHLPAGLYDQIYSIGHRLPGYCRYYRYARIVTRSGNPMRALAQSEDVYWAVRETIKSCSSEVPIRILEVGCGLGYLTAALRAGGYEAYGVDLSRAATRLATDRFGPWYSAVTTEPLHRQVAFRPDLIIALELIEHVPDPGAFLAELTRTLAPGGSILVSTPNRTNWGTTALWQTDLPPIHLHWFSELGMEALADGVGYCCEFTDFKRFNAFSARRRLGIGEAAVRAPLITADFDVVAPVSGRRENLLSTRIAPPMAVAVRMLQGRTTDRNRSGSMVVRLKAAYPNRPKSSGKGLTEQIGLA